MTWWLCGDRKVHLISDNARYRSWGRYEAVCGLAVSPMTTGEAHRRRCRRCERALAGRSRRVAGFPPLMPAVMRRLSVRGRHRV